MNILFLYKGYINPIKGGIQRVTTVLADYFEEKKGHTIFYLSCIRANKESEINKNRQFYLPDTKDSLSINNINYYKDFLIEKRIDIILNQNGMDPVFSELAYNIGESKAKLISCIHNSLLAHIEYYNTAYSSPHDSNVKKFLLRLTDFKIVKKGILQLYKIKYKKHYNNLCIKSDVVVLLSESFKKELIFFVNNTDKYNVKSIGNPISFKESDDLHLNKKNEILYVGRVDTSQKKVDLLLKIWSKIYMRNKDWSLNIIGGGQELPNLKIMAQKLNLERIHFLGFQNPEPFYKSAKIFTMTSSYEGFGIVLIEAMQFGTIPLAFDSYLSVKDIIDDSQNGFLVAPFDINQYVNKIQKLIDNENLINSTSKKSIEKAKLFSIVAIGDKWLDLFNTLNQNNNMLKSNKNE